MYILKKLNREKNVYTETARKELLAEGWEDVTPSREEKIAEALSRIVSDAEHPGEEPPAEDGGGKPDEEPPAGDDGEKPDEKPRRGGRK